MVAVNDVISLSTRLPNDPAVGYIAASMSSIVIARDPASVIMAAVSEASPSSPAGSCAEPTGNRNFNWSCGSGDFCNTSGTSGPVAVTNTWLVFGRASAVDAAADNSDAKSGVRSIPCGNGVEDNVVTMSPLSMKYLAA